MTQRTLIFPTPEALGEAVAKDILARLSAKTGRFLLGCPGGRSPRPVYAALSRLSVATDLDLSRLNIVMMDDYLTERFAHVPVEAHFSCRRFASMEIQAVLNANLISPHTIPDTNVWFPDPADPAATTLRPFRTSPALMMCPATE